MPNMNDAFPSNYLKASDLQGKQPIVTIDRVDFEQVGRSRETKPVLYFIGKEKGLILNKTNTNKIIELTQTAISEEWHGHRIALFSTHVEFQGDTVEAIRVKAAPRGAPAPRHAAPQPPPPPPPAREPGADDAPLGDITADDIPF